MLTLLSVLLFATSPPAHAIGDRDNWIAAKQAGAKYHVDPALLVAIRHHENPKRRNDYKACGVRDPSGRHKWYPGGMSGQYHKCAWIVARHAKRHGWSSMHPSRKQVSHLGQHYAEGSLDWGRHVWYYYSRMVVR